MRAQLTLWNPGNPTSSNVSVITRKEDGQPGGWTSEPERITGRIKQDAYKVPQRDQSRKATWFKCLLVTVGVTMIKYEDEQQQPFGKKTDIRFPSLRFPVRKGPQSRDWASR